MNFTKPEKAHHRHIREAAYDVFHDTGKPRNRGNARYGFREAGKLRRRLGRIWLTMTATTTEDRSSNHPTVLRLWWQQAEGKDGADGAGFIITKTG